jgi:YidC/Oxa1 family membrane protein insertase
VDHGTRADTILFLKSDSELEELPLKWWSDFVAFFSDSLDFFARLLHDYGLSILVVTVIIRLAILPFYLKQIRYMKEMQVLQPEIKKIRDKYKNDPQKLQQETMKLYQKHNINPFNGCLPMLLQLPILWAFYRAIMYNDHIKHAQFLGLIKLGSPDPYFLLPILAAVLTFFQQKIMMKTTISSGVPGVEQQQKMMLIIYPVMVLFIGLKLPAALSLYWVYGTIFTIAQTYFTQSLPAQKEANVE